jgi:TolB-like protein
MQAVGDSVFCFEDCTLDLRHGVLRRGNREVDLRAKSFALLRYLVTNAGRLVSKDELIQAIWPDVTVADESLARCVSDVRQALDDTEQRLIKTVPRRGYRFAAAISLRASEPKESTLALPDKPSIAVLPFLNMTGDPEQEYFTDGITEDIITEISRFHSLFVIARNSSFSYKGKTADVRRVGRDLGVRYVLEGSIRRSSNRIRVTAQLIDTFSGNHIWAERYDRVLEDIFAVQEEVTTAIVAAIAPQIEDSERVKAGRRRPESLTAYEIALRAWAHALEGQDKADPEIFNQSIREATEALTIDPNSVRALHALAQAHGNAVFLGMTVDRGQALREATLAAARAVELDSTDAIGYALRAANVMHAAQWERYPEALLDARRAHELNPNDTLVLRILGLFEAFSGEADRGIELMQSVLRLNPRDSRSYMTCNMLANACFTAKRYADTTEWAARAIMNRPQMVGARTFVVLGLIGMGDIDKAKAMFETLQKVASADYLTSRLEGTWGLGRSDDRMRATTFLRIAAGLEDPSAAEALR